MGDLILESMSPVPGGKRRYPSALLSAGWIAAIYTTVATGWIVASDALLTRMNVSSFFIASVAKGLSFVAVTGTGLWLVLRRRDWALGFRREELRLQASLLEQLQGAVIATDLGGDVVYWNSAAEAMYGWSADEALGRPVIELTVPERDRSDAEEIMEEIRRSGEWRGEFEVGRKDGTTFAALVSDSLYMDQNGEPAGLVGVSADMSDLRLAEREAERSARLAAAVIDSIGFPIAIVSDGGRTVDVNDAWETFAREVVREDPEGRDSENGGLGFEDLVPAGVGVDSDLDASEVAAGVSAVIDGDSSMFTHRYSCSTPDGLRWFRMRVVAIEGVGAAVAHIDVTNEMLALKVLEQTVEEKDRFLAAVSHELRTPLTAVVGFAESLRAGDTDPGELEGYYETIADQALEVSDLVEDLLLVGRLDTGDITFRPESFSPAEMIASVIRPWGRSSEVAVPDLPGDAVIHADPLRFRQVLRNLVANAIRHGAPPVEIRIERRPGVIDVQVIDHGQGVPESAIEEIFDAYTDITELYGQPGSVGLGLHISQRLAVMMGGELTYRRDDDTTVFTLSLPSAEE